MEHFARFIVKHRKTVLLVAVLLLIPSLLGAVGTRINYDILTYLPPELDSMIGEVALEDDFHIAATAMVTVEGLPTSELLQMKDDIAAVPGVRQAFWISDVVDVSVPSSMLPQDIREMLFSDNGATMMIVRFDEAAASQSTMNAVAQIKKVLRKDCFLGGMSVILQDTKALVDAILMTTRFHEELQNGHSVKKAVQISIEFCSQSILSSGLTFFAATIGVAAISRMELLQSICLLISRGALISMFVILFILPCLLILLAPVIEKTTLHWTSKERA